MARCQCSGSAAGTLIEVVPGSGLTIAGSGTMSDPYELGTDPSLLNGAFLGHREYTTAGTDSFAKADFPGVRWLHVICVGGGGGGSGCTAGAGVSLSRPGGSGGNYSESWIDAATVGASVTVTVGAGGAGGLAANGTGGDGGESSFGTLVTAPGGLGGGALTAPTTGPRITNGAAPAGPGTGQIRLQGEAGGPGTQFATGFGTGGQGGSSGGGYGGGDVGGIMNNNTGAAGNAGEVHGGGGGGASANNGGAFAGGAGARGIVIVEAWG